MWNQPQWAIIKDRGKKKRSGSHLVFLSTCVSMSSFDGVERKLVFLEGVIEERLLFYLCVCRGLLNRFLKSTVASDRLC